MTLVSPRQWRQAKLYPCLHPAARQSRRLDAEVASLWEPTVDIGRGEALYLPPFYLHRVETISTEPAVSLNAYLSSAAKDAAAEFATARLGGSCSLVHVATALNATADFLRDILSSRFDRLDADYDFFVRIHS